MPKRLIRVIVLTLLLLVGCGFAMWEILIFMQNAQPKTSGKTLFVDKDSEKFCMNDTDTTSPMELLQKSEKSACLYQKTLSPPPVAPPNGAKRIRAVGRKTIRDGYVELQWSYEISGDEKSVIAHYTKALKKEGFVLRSKKQKAQRVGMVFHRYPMLVTLSLKPAAGNGKILNITVCENRPERSGDFSITP